MKTLKSLFALAVFTLSGCVYYPAPRTVIVQPAPAPAPWTFEYFEYYPVPIAPSVYFRFGAEHRRLSLTPWVQETPVQS